MCEGDLVSLMFLFKVDGLSVFVFFGSRVSFYMSVPSLVWRRYVQYSPLPKRTQMHTDFRVPRRSSANNRSFFFTSTISIAKRNAEQTQITYNVKRKVSLPFS